MKTNKISTFFGVPSFVSALQRRLQFDSEKKTPASTEKIKYLTIENEKKKKKIHALF